MARDYKQANDRSIADVNRMNRDAWQSGDFRHVDAPIPPGSTNYNQKSTAAAKRAGLVMSSSEDVRHPPKGGQEVVSGGQVVAHHDNEDLNTPEKHAKRAELRERGEAKEGHARLQRELAAIRQTGPINKNKSEVEDRAVHLPRTAKKTWRKQVWS
jgi:hypothetical protein